MKQLTQYIKTTIQEFLNESNRLDDIDTVFQYYNSMNLNYELQENLDNSYEELRSLMNNNKITAYRVLNVDNIDDIDITKLGIHFTTDKENTTSEDFLEKIGVIDYHGNYDYEKFFIVTVETHISNVDWYKTFDNRINYYGEDEINFINDKLIRIVNIKEIKL